MRWTESQFTQFKYFFNGTCSENISNLGKCVQVWHTCRNCFPWPIKLSRQAQNRLFPKVWTNDMRIKWHLRASYTCREPGNRSASGTACRTSHLGRGAPIHIYGCAFCHRLTPHHNCRHVSFHPHVPILLLPPEFTSTHRHALSQPARRLLHRLDVGHVDGKVLITGARRKHLVLNFVSRKKKQAMKPLQWWLYYTY